MKKFGFLIFVIAVVGGAYYLYIKNTTKQSVIVEYPALLKGSSSAPVSASDTDVAPTNLTTMLRAGIKTKQGLLQSVKSSQNTVDNYTVTLAGKSLTIKAVSEIELVKAFLIKNQQVIVLAYNQGGNQCSRQYQILTLSDNAYRLSSLFGSCLPLTSIDAKGDELIFKMPANNPYLGKDVLVNYLYQDGVVSLLSKPTAKDLEQKYAKLTASSILKIAAKDGCYTGGVLLEDNSCDGGHKYCVMFKNLMNKPVSDADYKLLQDFCTQP